MQYTSTYNSPLGKILLAADEEGLIGLWFAGQKYYAKTLSKDYQEKETIFIKDAKKWLNIYFSGRNPEFIPQIHHIGTPFQILVWEILETIPYGITITYGQIAEQIAKRQGINKMSAQAVGSAVGHNNISIIVPCHRVIGKNNSLTGYAGGTDKKIKLLTIEQININNYTIPAIK